MKDLIRRIKHWWYYLRHREQYTWALRAMGELVSYGPWIVIGESQGLYLAVDEDTFCRWCGNNVLEDHNHYCDYPDIEDRVRNKWGRP